MKTKLAFAVALVGLLAGCTPGAMSRPGGAVDTFKGAFVCPAEQLGLAEVGSCDDLRGVKDNPIATEVRRVEKERLEKLEAEKKKKESKKEGSKKTSSAE